MNSKSFGTWMALRRKERGWKTTFLARRLRYSTSHLRAVECGSVAPSAALMQRARELFWAYPVVREELAAILAKHDVEEVARRVGRSAQAIRNWARGKAMSPECSAAAEAIRKWAEDLKRPEKKVIETLIALPVDQDDRKLSRAAWIRAGRRHGHLTEEAARAELARGVADGSLSAADVLALTEAA